MLFSKSILISTLTVLATAMPSGLHHQHKRADEESSSSYAQTKGISYTPYSDDGGCKSEETIASELKTIADYDLIRLYGTDCDQVSAVLKNKANGQKLFLGVYNPSQISEEVSTIKSAVESSGSWDDVYTVSIGNELVNSGEATVDQVGSYIKEGKKALSAAGYSGPVVSVDTFIAIINNPGLCKLSDYVAANAHAYFDGYYAAQDAGTWLLSQIQRVWDACDGKKDVFISESGWPSKGASNGLAIASKENQKDALADIADKCGNDTIAFTAFNDLWKADGSYGVEKFWGVFSE